MSCKTVRISVPAEPLDTEPNWPFLRWLDWLLTLPSVVHYLHQRPPGAAGA